MTDQNGPVYPPPYPPQQPYTPPPRGPSGSGSTILAAVLAAVFVVATVIIAYVAHHPDKSELASSGFSAAPVVAAPSAGVDGPQVNGTDVAPPSISAPTISLPPVAPLPSVTSAPALDPEAINRVFQVYMNALLYHDLSALKSATCPRLRNTETGTALHGHYIIRWRGKPYTIYNSLSYVTLSSYVKFQDAGSATYRWQVERVSSGRYYVCGFLS